MVQQIERFSPHQNAKVFAVLMAISSLVLLIPFMGLVALTAPANARPPIWLFAIAPLFYLVIGYIMVVIACWFYNVMFRFIGGIEFTSRDKAA